MGFVSFAKRGYLRGTYWEHNRRHANQMTRLAKFVRSVIPKDPAQLLMLGGSVLLFICMELRCLPVLPAKNFDLVAYRANDALFQAFQAWVSLTMTSRLPIVLAGAVGLFLCFFPGAHPVRRITLFVLLPAIGGIGATCGRALYLAQHSDFLFASAALAGPHNEEWMLKTLWGLGPAVHASIFGTVLILFFVSRLAMKIAELPVSLAAKAVDETSIAWRRIEIFVWISIVGVTLLQGLIWAALNPILSRASELLYFPHLEVLVGVLTLALLILIASWAVDGTPRIEMGRFTTLPAAQFAALGIVFPIVVNWSPNLGAYIWARINWVAFHFRDGYAPIFATYFPNPPAGQYWVLPAAALEEVIWRGYLQPRFVKRYGLMRGIFLVGIVWSAFHFISDFRHTPMDYQVAVRFAWRFAFCIAVSYVAGWLTLRSGSIWPAALAHGLHNTWAFSNRVTFSGQIFVVAACWGLVGFLLFRYWPPAQAEATAEPTPEIEPEPTLTA